MRFLVFTLLLGFVSAAWSQQDSNPYQPGAAGDGPRYGLGNQRPAKTPDANSPRVPNPFEVQPAAGGMGMGMGMNMGFEEGFSGMEMDYGGVGMEDMMVEIGSEISPDQQFRQGLQRAIQALKKATTDNEKETLHGYIRDAFEDRYAKMITARRRDLDKLKQSVAKLESDLKRREAAKDRVVQVQMQSVQLAAEGLLELGELQGGSFSSGGAEMRPGL